MVFEVVQSEDCGYFIPNWEENNEEERKMAMI
jgi:hypothetical protein